MNEATHYRPKRITPEEYARLKSLAISGELLVLLNADGQPDTFGASAEQLEYRRDACTNGYATMPGGLCASAAFLFCLC